MSFHAALAGLVIACGVGASVVLSGQGNPPSARKPRPGVSTPGVKIPAEKLVPIAKAIPVFISFELYPPPHACRMHGPTMPLVPIMPISGENRCIEPPRPREHPVARPNSSAISSLGGIPFANACPCPRCVLKIGSSFVR